jgi:hypothetical protein
LVIRELWGSAICIRIYQVAPGGLGYHAQSVVKESRELGYRVRLLSIQLFWELDYPVYWLINDLRGLGYLM